MIIPFAQFVGRKTNHLFTLSAQTEIRSGLPAQFASGSRNYILRKYSIMF